MRLTVIDANSHARFRTAVESPVLQMLTNPTLDQKYELWMTTNHPVARGPENMGTMVALVAKYHMDKARREQKIEPEKLAKKSIRLITIPTHAHPLLDENMQYIALENLREKKFMGKVLVDLNRTEELASIIGNFLLHGITAIPERTPD